MLVGSKWTMEHKGVPYDAVKGYASGKNAKEWCSKYGFGQSSRYEIAAYGAKEVVDLAEAWCEKLGHLYSLWLLQGDADYEFTKDDVASWKPSPLVIAMCGRLKPQPRKRVQEMLAQAPRVPI